MRPSHFTAVALAILCLFIAATAAQAAGGPGPIDNRPPSTFSQITQPGEHFSVLIRAQNARVIVLANCGTTYRRKPVTLDLVSYDKPVWMPFNGGYTRHGCEVIITTLPAPNGFANVGIVPDKT